MVLYSTCMNMSEVKPAQEKSLCKPLADTQHLDYDVMIEHCTETLIQ